MNPYHKIQSIYKRDPLNNFKTFLDGEWTQPEFKYLANQVWIGTEKIDGTNIRVIWDGETVRFAGRTDKAELPAPLFEYLNETFHSSAMTGAVDGPVTLYGEGYGGKIQKGSGYHPEQRFILFDVSAPCEPMPVWLTQQKMKNIASMLGIPFTPTIYVGDLAGAITMIKDAAAAGGLMSHVAHDRTKSAEGVVLRPFEELRDRMGRRIITKIKLKDFPNG